MTAVASTSLAALATYPSISDWPRPRLRSCATRWTRGSPACAPRISARVESVLPSSTTNIRSTPAGIVPSVCRMNRSSLYAGTTTPILSPLYIGRCPTKELLRPGERRRQAPIEVGEEFQTEHLPDAPVLDVEVADVAGEPVVVFDDRRRLAECPGNLVRELRNSHLDARGAVEYLTACRRNRCRADVRFNDVVNVSKRSDLRAIAMDDERLPFDQTAAEDGNHAAHLT